MIHTCDCLNCDKEMYSLDDTLKNNSTNIDDFGNFIVICEHCGSKNLVKETYYYEDGNYDYNSEEIIC